MKKFLAILLAVVMVLALSVTAFAVEDQAGTLADNGVVKNADHSSVGTTLSIPKGITVYGSMDKVYGPTVTYTYTIAPVAIVNTTNGYDNTVTDYNNKSVKVKAGPADGVSLSDNTAEFISSEVTLTSGSAEITDNIAVSVDLSKFTNTTYGPGVYRYIITDTTSIATLYNAGITRDETNYDTTRYLDVYLKYNAAGTALEVYGFVLLNGNVSPEGVDDQPLQWVTPTKKSTGFVAASGTSADGETTYTDEYHTIDVTLTKSVTGDMGNKNHQFPFAFNVSDNLGLNYYHKETVGTSADEYTRTTATSVSGVQLADTEVYSIKGLNPHAKISYTETNDTVDTYTLTVTDNGGATSYVNDNQATPAALNAVEIAMLTGTRTTATMAVSDYETNNSTTTVKTVPAVTNAAAILFTNNLDAVSPTGIALRFAPYALILAMGTMLLLFSRKTRKAED